METNFANKISFHWAIIGLLVVSMVWGTSYGVSKQILNQLTVVELLLIRFVISCAVLLSVIYFKQQIRMFTSQWRRYLQVGISTGLILSCIFLTETWAVKLVQAGQVAVLISLCVLFTPLLETAWLKVKLPKGIMLFCSIGFTGLVMIASPSELSIDLGVGLVIIAALLRAVMVVTCRKAFTKTPLQIEIITLIQLSVVTLISFCLVLLDSERPALIRTLQTLNSQDWASLLYLALCCTLLAFFVQNYAVKHLPASQASLLMGTEPMFGLLFASLFLSETMTPVQWLGCFIVITTTIAACYKFSAQK